MRAVESIFQKDRQAHYKTLICGATFSGIGAALAAPDTALLIERSAAVGQEYIESFNPGQREDSSPLLSGFGNSFTEELRQRNLIEAALGPVHLPGLHPVLCRRLLDAGAQVLLLTEILDIRKLSAGFEVDLYNASGIRTVTAGRILDTTTSRVSRPDHFQPAGRRLNAYIHTGNTELVPPVSVDPGVELVQGRFSTEHIVKWTLADDDDWPAARNGLLSYWRNRPSGLVPWTIAAIASVFDCKVPRGLHCLSDDWFWLPSKGYGHPVEAIDQGYVHQRRWEEAADGASRKV